ncbi:hypothetical protein [Bradyrhizobium sp. Gha]|uniref:hypothetical protein n=1 Tax=Bradyrhizobium sp. Gha TaxID=1855318 RepID=UPI0008E9483C|nr:hypothetical protein [Bradyrhizobium sp. Gha]SFJ71942.1 hypothetical protein SAMN05216525_13322 [Bradyrhizobium sp. Gha]
MSADFDFNTANGEQRTLNMIPAGTICILQLNIRPGGIGDDGYLTRAQDGNSEGLDCEFVVVEGPHAKRKLYQRLTLHGTTEGHAKAGEISRNTLRWVLESARGVCPDDKSEEAQAKRKITGWGELDGLRFVARLGIQQPQNGYEAKNTIAEIITPERRGWSQPDQVQTTSANASTPSAPPAKAIARPSWGG